MSASSFVWLSVALYWALILSGRALAPRRSGWCSTSHSTPKQPISFKAEAACPRLRRYLRPLILRDPNKHEEITDVYTEIALALHHASVASDKKDVHHHLRRLRPQLKKVFYYQHAVGSHLFALPNSQISLHHLDLLSGEVTHGSTGSSPGCADSIATEQQGGAKTDGGSPRSESSSHEGPVSYHTANGGDEGAPHSEAPSFVSARPRRCLNCARACGTSVST
nr:unnamed protein product [Spirometra erinaceieuropaei]